MNSEVSSPEIESTDADAAVDVADPDGPAPDVVEPVVDEGAAAPGPVNEGDLVASDESEPATEDPSDDASDDVDGPSVDELEGRLSEVEGAMGHLQSGALDEAESAITSLDQRIGGASD